MMEGDDLSIGNFNLLNFDDNTTGQSVSSFSSENEIDLTEQITELLGQFESENLLSGGSNNSQCSSAEGSKMGNAVTPRKRRNRPKRRSGNPAFHPEIRIFRRDIRRKYAFMFNNIMNAHDPSLLSQFLQEFAVPHFEAFEEIPENVQVKFCRMKVIQGQDQFVKTIEVNLSLMPDGVFRMADVKVCQRLNTSGSRILLNLSIVGTMLYEVIQSAPVGRLSDDDSQCQQAVYSFNSPPTLQILRRPFEYLMDSIITIQLDSNHRITSLELNVQNTEERSVKNL